MPSTTQTAPLLPALPRAFAADSSPGECPRVRIRRSSFRSASCIGAQDKPVGQYPVMPSVPGYVHTPGHHCGSTALRNLLGFHGVANLSEEMAFGLGAGACFYYVALEDASPTRWFNGRTARLEESFSELTGGVLQLRTFDEGDDGAWDAARAEVGAGNPVLLLTDLYYLDRYGHPAHFPEHDVV